MSDIKENIQIPESIQKKLDGLSDKDIILENIFNKLQYILKNSPENNILDNEGLIDLLRITHNENQNIQVFLEKQYFLDFLDIFGRINGFSQFFIDFIIKEEKIFNNFLSFLNRINKNKINKIGNFSLNELLEEIKKED